VSTALLAPPPHPPAAALTRDDELLANDVVTHLDVQLASAARLLEVVIEQGAAIRARDVQAVVHATGALQVELHRRKAIEEDRARLLERSGTRLGTHAGNVTLEALTTLMPDAEARAARERSARLRGLLFEVQREHAVNRALLSQELAFLDHLLRLVDGDGPGAYDAAAGMARTGAGAARAARRTLDFHA
jgi:hypothetical protein